MSASTLTAGSTWNESRTFSDPLTGRKVRQITTAGERNQTPTYHTGSCFTTDADRLVFVTQRNGLTALCCAEVSTGRVTVLSDPRPVVSGFNPMRVAMAARARTTVCQIGDATWLVDVDGGGARQVLPPPGKGVGMSVPAITPDGLRLCFTRMLAAPPGIEPGYALWEHLAKGDRAWFELVLCETSTGAVHQVRREVGVRCGHTQFSPQDPDLILLDYDYPPLFAWGSDGVHTRTRLVRPGWERALTLDSQIGTPFQVHSTFTYDGTKVVYHGWLGRDNHSGWYFSVFSAEGACLREYAFPSAAHYGHVSAAADRPAMILDGNLTADCFQFLYCDADKPRFEVIGHHGTEWGTLPQQESHPHPHHSNDGRWLAYTVAKGGRNDVYVMEM